MEKPSREWLTKLFNIDFKQKSFSLLLIETNLQSVLSNPYLFTPIIFLRIVLNNLILGMHFVPKDFKVDKPSGSFDTSTEVTGENKQLSHQQLLDKLLSLVPLSRFHSLRLSTLFLPRAQLFLPQQTCHY